MTVRPPSRQAICRNLRINIDTCDRSAARSSATRTTHSTGITGRADVRSLGMTGLAADRRTFLKGLGLLGAAALVPGCATSTKSSGSSGAATGELSLQSNLSSEQAKAAMEKLVAAYNKTGGSQVKLNTVAVGDLPDPAADVPDLGQPAGRLHLVRRLGRGLVREEGPAARRHERVGQHGQLPEVDADAVHQQRRPEDLRADQLLLVGHVLPEVELRQVGRDAAEDLGRVPRRSARRSRARASRRSASVSATPRGSRPRGSTT